MIMKQTQKRLVEEQNFDKMREKEKCLVFMPLGSGVVAPECK